MGDIKVTRYGVSDLNAQIGQRMVDDAVARKVTLSQILEDMNPSDSDDELSAFERQLEHEGIVTQTNRAEGYVADRFERFDKTEASRVLGAEWIDRQYRAVADMDSVQRRALISSDMTG